MCMRVRLQRLRLYRHFAYCSSSYPGECPQGSVNGFQGAAKPYVLCNMESVINKSTNKYICLYNLFIVSRA